MKKYEVMFIVKPDAGEAVLSKSINELKNVFIKEGGNVLEEKDMGEKELAYEINKSNKGYYYWFTVNAKEESIKEFDRIARINENVLRFICIKAAA